MIFNKFGGLKMLDSFLLDETIGGFFKAIKRQR